VVTLDEPLPEAVLALPVERPDGEPCALRDVLQPPAVLVVLRHFGCVGCDQQVVNLRPHLSMLAELGFSVVMVGNGAPEHARWFADRHHLPARGVTLVTDPSHTVHDAMGLVRSVWSSFGPRGLLGWARAIGRGYRQGGFLGDGRQQGGALVLDPRGVVRFLHRSTAIGHDPDAADLGRHALRVAAASARNAGHREIV